MFYYSATLFLWQHSIIHQLLDSIEAAPLVLWNIKRINICCILTVSGLCIIYSLLACKTVRTCEGMEYQSQSRVQLELPNLGNIRSVMEIKYSFRSFTLRTRETMIPGCWQLSRLRIQTSMALHELSTNGPFSSPTSRTRNIRKWDDLTTIQSVEKKMNAQREKHFISIQQSAESFHFRDAPDRTYKEFRFQLRRTGIRNRLCLYHRDG